MPEQQDDDTEAAAGNDKSEITESPAVSNAGNEVVGGVTASNDGTGIAGGRLERGGRLCARFHIIPSVQAVTNGIVRGEDLDVWDVLGMSEEDFERRFGGALGYRVFSIVEATPADAGVIADMMRGAQERMAGPWFKISDEQRVGDKLASGRGDGETGGDEAGMADGGTSGLLVKKGDQAVAYALFMKP